MVHGHIKLGRKKYAYKLAVSTRFEFSSITGREFDVVFSQESDAYLLFLIFCMLRTGAKSQGKELDIENVDELLELLDKNEEAYDEISEFLLEYYKKKAEAKMKKLKEKQDQQQNGLT